MVAGSCHGNLSGYELVAARLFWEVSRACYLVAKVQTDSNPVALLQDPTFHCHAKIISIAYDLQFYEMHIAINESHNCFHILVLINCVILRTIVSLLFF